MPLGLADTLGPIEDSGIGGVPEAYRTDTTSAQVGTDAMRIALNHTRFQRQGGVERYLWTLAHRLVEKGHEVHLFCSRFEGELKAGMTRHKVPVLPLGQSLKALSFAGSSRRLLSAERFDIVHAFGKTIYGDVYRDGNGCLRYYADYLRKYEPGLLGELGVSLSLKLKVFSALERARFAPGAFRRIVAVSAMIREQILSTYNIPTENVSVIYPGVDLERFRPELREVCRNQIRQLCSVPNDVVLGITVATGFVRKGIAPLLEALAQQRGRSWRFLILGEDKKRSQYEALTEQLGIRNRVLFGGWQPKVEEYLAAADFFVLNSRFDASGNSVLEAMAMALPCAVSSKAGFYELIREGENGFVIHDPDDPEELSAILGRLISDTELRAKLGSAARKTAEGYSLEHNIRDWLAIYEEVRAQKDTI